MTKLSILLSLVLLPAFASKMHLVKIKASTKEQRSVIANYAHMESVSDNFVTAIVNTHDLEKLKKKFRPSQMKIEKSFDSHNHKKNKIPGNGEYEFPKGDEDFHTYDEVLDDLKKLAKGNPEYVNTFVMGKSIEGRDLLGVTITVGSSKKETQKPAMMLIGTHHAREHLSTEIPLMLAEYFVEQIKKDSKFKSLMKDRVVYIVPLLNPDGALHDIVGKKYKMWRKNRKKNKGTDRMGVDLNRNYSYRWGQGGSSTAPGSDVYMGTEPFSEPETKAVKKFVESHSNIKTMISFHTFSELILYPWGGTYDPVGGQEEKVFKKMANTMAEWNGYKPQQSSDLYVATGDTCDWAFAEHNIFCFTFELTPSSMWSGGFYPGAKVINSTFKENIKPVTYLLEYTDDVYRVLK